jgi:hypothetical protein
LKKAPAARQGLFSFVNKCVRAHITVRTTGNSAGNITLGEAVKFDEQIRLP